MKKSASGKGGEEEGIQFSRAAVTEILEPGAKHCAVTYGVCPVSVAIRGLPRSSLVVGGVFVLGCSLEA